MNRRWWRDSETPECRQLPPNQRIANWGPAKQRQILLLGDEAVGWISRTCAVGCRFLSSPQRKWRRLLPLVGGLEQGRRRNMLLRSSSIWKRTAKSICFELCVETFWSRGLYALRIYVSLISTLELPEPQSSSPSHVTRVGRRPEALEMRIIMSRSPSDGSSKSINFSSQPFPE